MNHNIRFLNQSNESQKPENTDAYQLFFESNPSGMYLASFPDGVIENCNKAFAHLLGYESPLDLLGRKLSEFFFDAASYENFKSSITSQRENKGNQQCIRRSDGNSIWILQDINCVGQTGQDDFNLLATVVDITSQKQKEQEFLQSALYDGLTGLPNRSLFLDRLTLCFERARRNADYKFAVLFLDLDRFKWINDSFGHRVGDELLVAAAKRLNSKIRSGDTVARLSGDEFAVLLGEVSDTADATRVASRIQNAFQNPFRLGERELYITASIGIALSSGQWFANQEGAVEVSQVPDSRRSDLPERPEDLLWEADAVLYRAKQLGRARYEVFDASMQKQALSMAQMEQELRVAVEENQFVNLYDPVVSLQTGKVIGFEACLRWKHPRLGVIEPDQFYLYAEQIGVRGAMDRIFVRDAAAYLQKMQSAFPDNKDLSVSVNVTVTVLRDPEFIKYVAALLKEFGIEKGRLWFEVQESSLHEQFEGVRESLVRLREIGIAVILDDFGTGFSSLKAIPQFPIDMLKVDSSLIAGMTVDDMYVEVVGTLIALGHSFGFSIFADGVETERQVADLKRLGCEASQGKYFSDLVEGEGGCRLIEENRSF